MVSLDTHLGEYTFDEILYGNVFKLNLGILEKASSEYTHVTM